MTAPLDPRLVRLIEDGERFAILTHVSPDGDGLGSELGLLAFLRQRGKQARIINPDPVPAHYRFMALAAEAGILEGDAAEFLEGADGVFVVDNGSLERLGALAPHVRAARGLKVLIDHHETRDDCWDIEVVDVEASASGELVYLIIQGMGGTVTPEIAEALYVSVITDTGHFRFSKTRPLSHRISAEFLAAGVEPARIYQKVYEGKPEGYLRLMGHALDTMVRDDVGWLIWTSMDAGIQSRLGAAEEDTGGIINNLLAIEGIQLALLFRELPDGKVKVSLRSKGAIDVSALAQRHGGGGHRNASGILMDGPLDAAARFLVGECAQLRPQPPA